MTYGMLNTPAWQLMLTTLHAIPDYMSAFSNSKLHQVECCSQRSTGPQLGTRWRKDQVLKCLNQIGWYIRGASFGGRHSRQRLSLNVGAMGPIPSMLSNMTQGAGILCAVDVVPYLLAQLSGGEVGSH